jgi:hypothetical protein
MEIAMLFRESPKGLVSRMSYSGKVIKPSSDSKITKAGLVSVYRLSEHDNVTFAYGRNVEAIDISVDEHFVRETAWVNSALTVCAVRQVLFSDGKTTGVVFQRHGESAVSIVNIDWEFIVGENLVISKVLRDCTDEYDELYFKYVMLNEATA